MHGSPAIPDFILSTCALLLVLAATAALVRRTRLPLTVALVAVGILIKNSSGHTGLTQLSDFHLSPEIVLFALLPLLLFEAAMNLDSRQLRRDIVSVAALAVPALLVSVSVVAGVMMFAGMPIAAAIVFGALVSATDPVAVLAVFKQVGAPKRLAVLVDGESLFNDGTAAVTFRVALAMALSGAFVAGDIAHGAVQLINAVLAGVGIGIIVGWIASKLIQHMDDQPMAEITITLVAAYLAFVVGEHLLHVSGVIATVVTGLVAGAYGRYRVSPRTREALHWFWEYSAFLANGLVFLLVGMTVCLTGLYHSLLLGLCAVIACTVARALAVYAGIPLVNSLSKSPPIDRRYQTVMFWGDMRGALALALAISIPEQFAYRQMIIDLTICVVLYSLFAKGLSMPWLVHRLGLDKLTRGERFDRQEALAMADRAVLGRIDHLKTHGLLFDRICEGLRARHKLWAREAWEELSLLGREDDQPLPREIARLSYQCLGLKQHAYDQLHDAGELSLHSLEALRGALTEELESRHGKAAEDFASILDSPRPEGVDDAPRGPLGRPHRLQQVALAYEQARARAIAVATVLEFLGEEHGAGGVSEEAYDAVREHFNHRRERALDECRRIEAEHASFAQVAQAALGIRACLEIERDSIEESGERGALSSKVLQGLEGDIGERLHAIGRTPAWRLAAEQDELAAASPQAASSAPETTGLGMIQAILNHAQATPEGADSDEDKPQKPSA